MLSVRRLALVWGFCLCLCAKVSAAEPLAAASRVSAVTVYPDSALVSRSAQLQLTAQETTVVFAGLVPALDEDSLRVSGNGSALVKILGARVEKEYLEEVSAEEVKKLEQELQGLADEKQMLLKDTLALEDEKKFLDSFRFFTGTELPKELITQIPAPEKLTGALRFLQEGLADYYARSQELGIAARGLDKKIEVLRRRLGELSGGAQKIRRSIVLELEVQKAGDFVITASYLVRGASWRPQYDARASFDKGSIELVSYGMVRQNTGEEWQDVQLSLSTARPSRGGRMPYVDPWFLRPLETHGGALMREKTAAAPSRVGYQMMALRADEDKLEEPEEEGLSLTEEKGVAVVYTLTRSASVASDGVEHKLPVFSQTMPADFVYSSYPRATPVAFLGSRVKNSADAQLLGGKVSVFLDGDYVGASSIDTIGPAEEFDLYLGVDENVKIKRELKEKKVDQTLIAGIPSNTRKTLFTYKLTVENYKTRPAAVKLFEAMPVSQDDRIKVKVDSVSMQPRQKDWEDRLGVWLWEFTLPAGAKKEITYSFIVEHPRTMNVEGL